MKKIQNHISNMEYYKLYTEPWEIDTVQKLEKELFVTELFNYNRDITVSPFRNPFDNYYFLTHNYLFRKPQDYNALVEFVIGISSLSFFISAPSYAVLYPLEISVYCPFSIYKDAPAYVLEEVMDSGKRPLQHPRSGVGFVTIPDVFMYDQTKEWAILNNDGNLITIIGVNNNVKQQFLKSFNKLELLSISEAINVMETFQTGHLSSSDKEAFYNIFYK